MNEISIYFIQTCVSIAVGFIIFFNLELKSKKIASNRIKTKKKEFQVFITVAIIQLGFTLTLGRIQ